MLHDSATNICEVRDEVGSYDSVHGVAVSYRYPKGSIQNEFADSNGRSGAGVRHRPSVGETPMEFAAGLFASVEQVHDE